MKNNMIPQLIVEQNIDKSLALFLNLEDENFYEYLESNYDIYKTLDIFKETLSFNDSGLTLIDNEYFRLKEEQKYLNLIEVLFKENGNSVHILGNPLTNPTNPILSKLSPS